MIRRGGIVEAIQDKINRQDKIRQDKTRHGKTRQDKTRQDKLGLGLGLIGLG